MSFLAFRNHAINSVIKAQIRSILHIILFNVLTENLLILALQNFSTHFNHKLKKVAEYNVQTC